jgi:ribosome-associated heat shock protein Hsp15
MESTRVDRWLTAVRLCKTRNQAAELCTGGKVRINGVPAKPSSAVRAGDRIEARINKRERVVEVLRVIDKRVGAAPAAECYEDHSPPPDPALSNRPVGRREPGAGRPTKRDRRKLRDLRGR